MANVIKDNLTDIQVARKPRVPAVVGWPESGSQDGTKGMGPCEPRHSSPPNPRDRRPKDSASCGIIFLGLSRPPEEGLSPDIDRLAFQTFEEPTFFFNNHLSIIMSSVLSGTELLIR